MQLKKKEAMLKEKKKKVSHLCFRPTTGHLTSFKDYMDTLQFKKKQTNRKRRLKRKMLLRSMRLGRKRRQKASNLRPKRRKL